MPDILGYDDNVVRIRADNGKEYTIPRGTVPDLEQQIHDSENNSSSNQQSTTPAGLLPPPPPPEDDQPTFTFKGSSAGDVSKVNPEARVPTPMPEDQQQPTPSPEQTTGTFNQADALSQQQQQLQQQTPQYATSTTTTSNRFIPGAGYKEGIAQREEALNQQNAALATEFEGAAKRQEQVSKLYEERAKLDQDYAAQERAYVEQHRKESEARLRTISEQEQQLLDQKLDPDRWWNQKSTAGRIGTEIALFIGGFAHGYSLGKVENVALNNVNKLIERDIEAQKENFRRSKAKADTLKGDYARWRELGRDEDEARRLAYISGKSRIDALLEQKKSTVTDEEQKAKLEQLQAKNRQEIAQLKINEAKAMGRNVSSTTRRVPVAGGGGAGDNKEGVLYGRVGNIEIAQGASIKEKKNREGVNKMIDTTKRQDNLLREYAETLQRYNEGEAIKDAAALKLGTGGTQLGVQLRSIEKEIGSIEKDRAATGANTTGMEMQRFLDLPPGYVVQDDGIIPDNLFRTKSATMAWIVRKQKNNSTQLRSVLDSTGVPYRTITNR